MATGRRGIPKICSVTFVVPLMCAGDLSALSKVGGCLLHPQDPFSLSYLESHLLPEGTYPNFRQLVTFPSHTLQYPAHRTPLFFTSGQNAGALTSIPVPAVFVPLCPRVLMSPISGNELRGEQLALTLTLWLVMLSGVRGT